MKPVSATIDPDAPPPGPARPRAADETRARERAARLAPGAVRDLRSADIPGRSDSGDDAVRPFRLGWAASLLLNLALLGAPLGLVIALPPVLDCRERESRFGFFAGETLANCSRRGIEERLKRLDDRMKMLVRGSGR